VTLKPVTIFALGGTIAMSPGADGSAVPALSADQLITAVPELGPVADIEAVDFRQLPGAHLRIEDSVALAHGIKSAQNKGAHGVVVTQGTDTIEETAFVLDLLCDPEFRVVVTGAMRHPAIAGADGAANLLAAVTVAATPEAAGFGAMVVMNDEIHAGAYVRKTHATRPNAFASPDGGQIGMIVEGKPHFLMRPTTQTTMPLPDEAAIAPTIAIVGTGLGDGGEMAKHIENKKFSGLVIEAMGAGHLSEQAASAYETLAGSMPVVFASRTNGGMVLENTYGFPGSESDLLSRGLIRAGWLTAPKARLLLALCLMNGLDMDKIRNAFAKFGGG
jgi:L-asparaginase